MSVLEQTLSTNAVTEASIHIPTPLQPEQSSNFEQLLSELRAEESVIEVDTNIPFEFEGQKIVKPTEFNIPEKLKKGFLGKTYEGIERLLKQGFVYLDSSPDNPNRRIWKNTLAKTKPNLRELIVGYHVLSRNVLNHISLAASFLCENNKDSINDLKLFSNEGENRKRLSELHNRTDLRRKEIALERSGLLTEEILATKNADSKTDETDWTLAEKYLKEKLRREGFEGDIDREVELLMVTGKPEYTSFDYIVGAERKQYLENLESSQKEKIAKEVDRTLAREYHQRRLQEEGFEGDVDREVGLLMVTGKPEYTSFIYIVGMETKQYLADFVKTTKDLSFEL